jgi:hypothetical protein
MVGSPSKTGDRDSEGGAKVDIGIFQTANHPIACLFHILFKVAAIFR